MPPPGISRRTEDSRGWNPARVVRGQGNKTSTTVSPGLGLTRELGIQPLLVLVHSILIAPLLVSLAEQTISTNGALPSMGGGASNILLLRTLVHGVTVG